MKTCVVGESHGCQILFPVQSCFVHKRVKILGNCFVAHFCLRIALRMVGCCSGVFNVEPLVKLGCQFVSEFFAVVRNDFQGCTISANPFVKDCFSRCFSFFVCQGYQFHIFGKSVCHTQDHFLPMSRSFERSKQVNVYSLVRCCTLW